MGNTTPVPRRARFWLKPAGLGLALLLVFGLGYTLGGPGMPPGAAPDHEHAADADAGQERIWTCSMHSQIRQNKPGLCPLCGMDLVPVAAADNAAAGPREFVASEGAKALMNVETAEVLRRFVTREVRMVGKIDYDETRLAYITAWVPGRLDRLYVDYTGIRVNQGDHMVRLYSPELLVAQDELRRASKVLGDMSANAPDALRRTAESTRNAARERLRRWGLANAQIEEAEKQGVVSDHITIYAPMGGTVIRRDGQEGMYVEQGTRLYTLADLDHLWVQLNAYESDLSWLHYGQKALFTTEAYPGEEFEGRIAFIDPVLDAASRTVNVRLVVLNPGGKLKPEMFVRAVVRAQLAEGGRVMDPELAGKWISPMHPEIIKDGPGTCDVCGMPLVRAETLGFVSARLAEDAAPLVIPASAPLITGARAVVYVEVPGRDRPTFEGREIVLGPRAGDFYLVRSGLEEGEHVVVRGNFKIDSALQIQARPSMMLPSEEIEAASQLGAHHHSSPTHEAPEAFRAQLRALYSAYSDLAEALASDDFEAAKEGVSELSAALAATDAELLDADHRQAWTRAKESLHAAVESMEQAAGIDDMRNALPGSTDGLTEAITAYGIAEGPPVYRAHCPMAFEGKGGDWLQPDTPIRNPYYGSAMLACGELTGRLDALAHDGDGGEAGHE